MEWEPIANCPRNDIFGWVRWNTGEENITIFDAETDSKTWEERGAVQWRHATSQELDDWQMKELKRES